MVSFALEINWRGLDLQHSWMKPVDGCRASGNNNDHFRRLRQFGYCQEKGARVGLVPICVG